MLAPRPSQTDLTLTIRLACLPFLYVGCQMRHDLLPSLIHRRLLHLRREYVLQVHGVHAREKAVSPEALRLRHREEHRQLIARGHAELNGRLRAAQHDDFKQALRGFEEGHRVHSAREVERFFEEAFGSGRKHARVEPVEEAPELNEVVLHRCAC